MGSKNYNYSILVDVDLDVQKQKLQKQLNEALKGTKLKLNTTVDTSELDKSTKKTAESARKLGLSYQAANAILRKTVEIVSSMTEQVYELDSALTEFKKVSDLSGDSLNNYVKKLSIMGAQVARTTSEMVEASTEFKKSGFSDEDAANLALVSTMYQNVADEAISAGEASNFIISQLKAFNLEASDATHVVDALNAVSNKFAVSSSEISENIGKSSAAMATSNVTFEQNMAMLVAITEVTRSASRSSRALVSINSRFTQILDEQSSVGKALLEIYKGLGIEVFDQTGQIRSLYDVMSDLSKIWPTLSTNQKQYIALTQAGSNQSQNFLSLLSNFNTAIEANKVALNSNGSALEENSKYMESLEAKTNNLKATFQDLSNNIINNQLIKSLLDLANNGLKLLNTGMGQTITQTGLLTAGITGLIGVGKFLINPIRTTISLHPELLIVITTLTALVGILKNANKEFKELNKPIEDINSQLETNKNRLEEINNIPWYDRTAEINKEKNTLEEENKALQNQIDRYNELNKKKAEKVVYGDKSEYKTTSYTYSDELRPTTTVKASSEKEALEKIAKLYGTTTKELEKYNGKLQVHYTWVSKTADAYQSELIQSGTNYINTLKNQGKISEENIDSFNKFKEEINSYAQAVKDSGIAYDNLDPKIKHVLEINEELNHVFDESVSKTKAMSTAFGVTASQADNLKKKEKAFSGAIEENNGVLTINATKLFGVSGQSSETKKRLADLIATETIFNQSSLNVNNKIKQLYELAKAAGATASSIAMINNVSNAINRPGLTGTERVDFIRSQFNTFDFSSAIDKMWSEVDFTPNEKFESTGIGNIGGSRTVSTGGGGGGGSKPRPAEETEHEKWQKTLALLKDQVTLAQKSGAPDEEIIDKLKKVQEAIHNQAEKFRAMGLSEEHEYMRELGILWWDYQGEIDSVYDEIEKREKEAAKEAQKALIDSLQEKAENYKKAIGYIIDKTNEEIDVLKKERDETEKYWNDKIEALQKANEETKRQIELEKAQEELAKAKNKKGLVFKDGKYQYISDVDAVSQASSALEDIKREEALRKEVENLEALKNQALESIDKQIEGWEEYKKEWEDLVDDYEHNQDKLLAEQVLGVELENDNWEKRLGNARDFVEEYNSILEQLKSAEEALDELESEGTLKPTTPPTITDTDEGMPKPHTQSNGTQNGVINWDGTWSPFPGGPVYPTPPPEYANGTLSAKRGISLVGENGPELRVLNNNDGILPTSITKNLWNWGSLSPNDFINNLNANNIGKALNIIIQNLNLPQVTDGESFIDYMQNNFMREAVQFSTKI